MITSITSPFQDAIVATPQPYAREVIRNRVTSQRAKGYWKDREERIKFRVFFLLDGKKHHRRIGEILHMSEPEVRQAIFLLMIERLISIEVLAKENTMNVQLLSSSFNAIKPHGMEFAKRFYTRLFELGRVVLGTNEIEQLFPTGDDIAMKKQYEALLGALAYVIAGVLANKHDVIKADLIELGIKHRQKGVKNVHYSLVGQSLIVTLQEYFGPNWTPELEQTWTLAYEFVSNVMMEVAS